MIRHCILTGLLSGWVALQAPAATYSNLSAPLCDDANHVIYDGKGHFAVQSAAETTLELIINLPSLLSYANSNDYKSGNPLLLWDADFADYGLTDLADTAKPTGSRTPALTGYAIDKIWKPERNISYATLQKYADTNGNVTLRITNSNKDGVTVTACSTDGSEQLLYKSPELRYSRNKKLNSYRVNLNYVTAVNLLTPSTLDTTNYTPPKDYTIPFESQRTDGLTLKRVMFMGDSITHGVNDCTWRWQLFKILVDNGVEAEIVGPRSGYTPGYAKLATKDSAMSSYGGTEFPNVHLAQSSGRTHNIITGSNAGMTGVNYGGHSTASSAATFNCDTWFCLMGTNDLLSDRGYTEAEFCAKMQRLLGGKVSCKKGKYTWSAGNEWGTMSRIATDVLKDKNDVLYITPSAKAFELPENVNVPVLMYHAVSDDMWGISELFVSPSEMEKQLAYLVDNGYDPIWFQDLSHVEDYDKPVILTFDDGYDDNFTELFPLLQKYEVKATEFVIGNAMGKSHKMTAEQVKELSDSELITVQSHGYTHHDMDVMGAEELEYELGESWRVITRATGKIPSVLCYPTGKYNGSTLEIAEKYYNFGLKMNGGLYNTSVDDPYLVSRYYISRYTDIYTFAAYIEAAGT